MPNFEEIDRAYEGPRRRPVPALDGYKKFVTRSTTVMALLSIILGFGPGAGSAIDRLFGLGWAIQWRDVWIGLGISVATAILYLFTALGSPSLASTAWLPITKMPERPKTGAPEV
jgi:hypothetical protein